MSCRVDEYLRRSKWQEELEKLRRIILDCGLTEELKWDKPCYTFQNSNIVILQGFKGSCALLFAKGAMLNDPKRILEKAGESTQAARWVPFTNVRAIAEPEPVLKAYINQAIEAETAGLEGGVKKHGEPTLAE